MRQGQGKGRGIEESKSEFVVSKKSVVCESAKGKCGAFEESLSRQFKRR